MSLASGLRVGGVFVDVRLDTSRLRDDFARMKREAEQYARDGVRVGAPGGGTGGGASSFAPTLALGGGLGGLAGAIRSTGGTTNALLRQAVASLRTVATAQSNQDRAARSAFRAERGQFRQAGLRQAGGFFAGRPGFLSGPEGRVNSLPADVRYLGGIGFDEARPFRTPGDRAGGAAGAAAEAAVARDVPPIVADVMQATRRAAVTAADSAARTTAAGGYPMRPGPIRGRRPALPGDDPTVYGVVGDAPGTVSGNFRRGGRRRSGSADLSMLPMIAGRLGLGLVGAVGGSIDASFLALNRFQSGMEGLRRGMDRMRVTLGPLRSALSGTFSAALLPLRLFSRGVDDSVRSMGAVATVSRGMQGAVAAPFRAAISPLTAFVGLLRSLGMHLGIIGTFLAGRALFRGIMFASAMNEEINVSRQAFGSFADGVRTDARAMARGFGLVEEAMLETSNTFGLILTGMDVSRGAAARLSTELARLTADMSSFYDVSQEDAAEALRSGLIGRFRPLTRFGVVISAEDVENLAEARGEADRAGIAMARLTLIQNGLATASGDLARTMNSPANLMREFRGRAENLVGEIGAGLLPAFRELLLMMNEAVAGRFGRALVDAFARAGEAARGAIHFVRQALSNMRNVQDLASAAFGVVRENMAEIIGWLGRGFAAVMGGIGSLLAEALKVAFEGARTILRGIWEGIGQDFVGEMGKAAAKAGDDVRKALLDPIGFRNDLIGRGAQMLADSIGKDKSELALDETNRNLGGLLGRFAIDLPGLNLPGRTRGQIVGGSGGLGVAGMLASGTLGSAMGDLQAAITRIAGIALRGDDGEGDGSGAPRGRLRPEGDAEDSRRGRQSGQFISARQLVELQNQSSADQERRRVARETAVNTRRTAEGIDRLLQQAGGGGINSLVAVAAP